MLNRLVLAELKNQKNNMAMSYEVVAARSGLGVATVKRAFLGKSIAFETLEKIAAALECEISVTPKGSAKKLYDEQVEKKARGIVERVMKSSALEDQTPGSEAYDRMLDQAKESIRKMPKSKIWV